MKRSKFPKGWDSKRVRDVIAHYDRQTDAEAVKEYESAIQRTMMEVPVSLVPAVRQLLAKQAPKSGNPPKRSRKADRAA